MSQNQQREQLGSRIGFLLLAAGCAIGLGNVWRFPYIAGAYGGALFVFIYIGFLLAVGVPIWSWSSPWAGRRSEIWARPCKSWSPKVRAGICSAPSASSAAICS